MAESERNMLSWLRGSRQLARASSAAPRRKERKRQVRGRRVFHVKARRSDGSIEMPLRMIHAIIWSRLRMCDDAVQKFHRNRKRRKRRRGVAESTRSIVIAAAPHHLMFVPDLRVPRSRRRTMKIETRVRLSAGPLRTKYGSKCHVLP